VRGHLGRRYKYGASRQQSSDMSNDYFKANDSRPTEAENKRSVQLITTTTTTQKLKDVLQLTAVKRASSSHRRPNTMLLLPRDHCRLCIVIVLSKFTGVVCAHAHCAEKQNTVNLPFGYILQFNCPLSAQQQMSLICFI